MTNLTTIQLVNLCKEQDRKAQMTLYNNYCDAMFNVSFRIVQDIYVAEDMMQEAFIKAFEQLGKLKEPKTFGSWLKRIVINNSLNYIQKNKNHNESLPLDDVLYKVESGSNEDSDIDLASIKATEIVETIQELKDNYRLLLNLHYVEGYDYEEIVEITGLTYANCRTTISRAKESLKSKLKQYA